MVYLFILGDSGWLYPCIKFLKEIEGYFPEKRQKGGVHVSLFVAVRVGSMKRKRFLFLKTLNMRQISVMFHS